MTRLPEPLGQIRTRLPEAGRIRLGEKTTSRNGKTIQATIDVFRFTSVYQALLEQLAALYGGQVTRWEDPTANPPKQWQLYTETDTIRVAIPGRHCISQWYEMWSRGGCVRRCDGLVCQTSVKGPNGSEPAEVPCLCTSANKMDCKPKTRLTVVIPNIDFGGTWRLETSSEAALRELPGMVDVIAAVAQHGFTLANLSIAKHRVAKDGETKVFNVPALSLPFSPEQIAAGAATLGALNRAGSPLEQKALGAGHAAASVPSAPSFVSQGSDEIVDAEVVGERDVSPLEQRCREVANRMILDGAALWEAMVAECDGDLVRVERGVVAMEAGRLEPGGIVNGRVQWITK